MSTTPKKPQRPASPDPKGDPASEAITCGIVMPISLIDGCTADHWLEVRSIIEQAVGQIPDVKFDVRMVSEADNTALIHKRIVQSIYDKDVVICDLSCKNPNVMFELGLRLAFDKPVILIIDDRTDYIFDVGLIEHVKYPRDLRYTAIVKFKDTLADKVSKLLAASKKPDYVSFLKAFGSFKVVELAEEKVDGLDAVLARIDDLSSQVRFAVQRSEMAAASQSELLNERINREKHSGRPFGLPPHPALQLPPDLPKSKPSEAREIVLQHLRRRGVLNLDVGTRRVSPSEFAMLVTNVSNKATLPIAVSEELVRSNLAAYAVAIE